MKRTVDWTVSSIFFCEILYVAYVLREMNLYMDKLDEVRLVAFMSAPKIEISKNQINKNTYFLFKPQVLRKKILLTR